MIKQLILLSSVLLCISAHAQVTIATARTQATGSTVTVRGIVINGSEFGSSTRYIMDATGGATLYGSGLSSSQRGDTVQATGTVSPYNNLFEIAVTSVSVVNSSNPLPAPQVVTLTSGYNEAYEGELVRINNVSFPTSTGSFAGSINYNITDGSTTAQIRLNNASNLVGTPIPSGTFDVVGIMSQFCVSPASGCTSGYQLIPRDLGDFIVAGNPPVLTTSLSQNNITTTSFNVLFSTMNNGNTIIRYGTTSTNLNLNVTDATQTLAHSVNLSGLQPATIYYVQGLSISATNDTSFSSVQPMATASLSSGTIQVYFNRPVNNTYSTGTNAVFLNQEFDDTLKAYIARAQHTLDIAIYNVDDVNGIVTAINQAAANGITVRVVCDDGVSSTVYNSFINSVGKIKSPVQALPYGIMHNKMVIIDANSTNPNEAIYWTGSTNFTDEQLNSDANDVIIFQDQSIAKSATLEFNEMYGSAGNNPNATLAKFGPDKVENTPHEFMIGGKRVEMYFSPSDIVNIHVKNDLLNANQTINFSVFAFTRTEEAYAITDAITANGVLAQGLMETPADTTVYNILSGQMTTANLKVDNNPYLIHHKYAIVDAFDVNSDPLVITGSYNWSNAATVRNDENIIIVHDATIANIYFQEWAQRFADAGGIVMVGTNDIANESTQIVLYPNPAQSSVYINYSVPNNDQPMFRLYDVTGRVVKTWSATSSHGNDIIDLHNVSNGMYLLNVTTNTFSRTVRLEKQ